mmetsp:Transcript_15672/g.17425  ORF Transcript_15672/g.17425 Transcript_15672/m.17425 type:complete len:230 (+) Transcript_15672:33-722(+)
MPILYAVVASGSNVLVESGDVAKFNTLVSQILVKVQKKDRKSYLHGGHTYNYLNNGNLTFLCVTDKDFLARVSFDFLKKIESVYSNQSSTKFTSQFKELMETYSDPHKVDRVTRVKSKLDDVKGVMIDNIDKVMERGEALDTIEERTADLSNASMDFRRSSTTLRKVMWWKNVKLWIVLGVLLVVLLFVVVWIGCGLTFANCRSHHHDAPVEPTSPISPVAPVTPVTPS